LKALQFGQDQGGRLFQPAAYMAYVEDGNRRPMPISAEMGRFEKTLKSP
jgi:hypothetical protein